MEEQDYSREKRHLVYPGWHFSPDDFINFVQSDEFVVAWKELGLDDDDLRAVEVVIMANPEFQHVIEGTGGLRIGEFEAVRDGEPEPSVLVGYFFFPERSIVYLVASCDQSELTELTERECAAIRSEYDKIKAHLSQPSKVEVKGASYGHTPEKKPPFNKDDQKV